MRVSVEVWNDRLRLRWKFEGKRYCLSPGLSDNAVNRIVAEQKARIIELDLLSSNFDPSLRKYKSSEQLPDNRPVWVLFENFLSFKEKQGISPRTAEKYRSLGHQLKEFFGDRPAGAIALNDCFGFRDWLLNRVSPRTAKEYLSLCASAWRWLSEEGVSLEPHWDKVLVRVQLQRMPRPFSKSEVQAIVNGFEMHPYYAYYADFVKFLFGTGCRIGEAIGFRWGHATVDCSVIWIGESISRGVRKSTKTNRSREFRAPRSIQSLLIRRRPEPCAADDLVFPSKRGGAIDDHNFRNRAWSSVLEIAGVEYRKPYNTRSTAVSQMLEAGLSPTTVASITGHDVSVLYTHYAGAIASTPQIPDWLGD